MRRSRIERDQYTAYMLHARIIIILIRLLSRLKWPNKTDFSFQKNQNAKMLNNFKRKEELIFSFFFL